MNQHTNGHGVVRIRYEKRMIVQQQSHIVEMELKMREKHVIQKIQANHDGEMDDVMHHVMQLQ